MIRHAKPLLALLLVLTAAAALRAEDYYKKPKDALYIGTQACAACHSGPDAGHQMEKWQLTAHARAYTSLDKPESAEIVRLSGLTGDPYQLRMCMGCHATASESEQWEKLPEFRTEEGLQCEACHGPGSEYATDALMRNPKLAREAGLIMPTKEDCRLCHRPKGSHDTVLNGKPFDMDAAWDAIAHPTPEPGSPPSPPPSAPIPVSTQSTQVRTPIEPQPAYKNPLNLALTPDGRELWVACEASASVIVVDTATRAKRLEIPVGGQPNDVCFTPDGRRAFVSNRLDDTVSVVDVTTRQVIATIPVGDEPHGVLVDREGRYLYVLNTSIDNISVIDASSLKEVKRLSASRSPWSLALSPDGASIVVTHALSRFTGDRKPAMSELTVIDTASATVRERITVPAANLLQGVSWHPSGRYALFTQLRTKNLVPMTRINHGWTITNSLGLYWADGRVDQVLLDFNDVCFPDPADVVITPDGRYALVTSSGSDQVAVVDLDKLVAVLEAATPHERERVIPNHTGIPTEYVVGFIRTGTSPKGITCSTDGRTAYVASMLDDSVAVLDLARMENLGRIDLGGALEEDRRRRGEKLFHSANITFRRQFSCSSCHPDGHIDNLVYDIEDDGLGMGPIDNRTLRGIADMAPYKWIGINPNLKRQCGPRLAVFITRIHPFTADQLTDLHDFICSIPRPPNRYRKLGEDLTEAQRRGKYLFERTHKNDGTPIPRANRCSTCHPAPLYTDGLVHDVGTRFAYDRDSKFDAPHLLNIYDSAPYLHNGIAATLEEIWTVYNPHDTHGVTNDMTKDQLNDLIEFLKTL